MNVHTLGIIAGSRSLPLVVAREARAQGLRKLVAVAFTNETDPQLAGLVDQIEWFRVGQLSRMIAFFKEHEVHQCVMAGQVAPNNLFDLRPDLRALKVLLTLPEKNAHSLFGAVARELEKDGIELIEATPWLKPYMPAAGFQLGPTPSEELLADARFGLGIAKEISRLDIGQTVVVKGGTVLAVEGFEGTDACLMRGGQLAGKSGEAVAVKVAKPNHDMRFDIPCVGAKTIETCHHAGIRLLGVEGAKTLLLELEEMKEQARKKKVTVLTL
jgi:DUF1009 family protein